MSIEIKDLKEIMEQIKNLDYSKSKQVEQFIEDVLEHFGETITGQ